MKIMLNIIAILFISSHASADLTEYAEYNFSIEIPSNWTIVSPSPPLSVAAFQSPDQLKIFILNAIKPPQDEKNTSLRDTNTGIKDGMIEAGWEVSPEQQVTFGHLSFNVISGHMPSNISMSIYTTVAGDFVYTLQAINKAGNAVDDPELKSIIESFYLLSPVKSENNSKAVQPTAYLIGRYTVKFLFWVCIPIIVLLSVWKGRRPNQPSSANAKNRAAD